MHLKLFLLVTLLALGSAVRQSRMNRKSEGDSAKPWKDSDYDWELSGQEEKFETYRSKDPITRKYVRSVRSPKGESVLAKSSKFLNHQSGSRENGAESIDNFDDCIGTRNPEENMCEDSFRDSVPMHLASSTSGPKKPTLVDAFSKSTKPAEDSDVSFTDTWGLKMGKKMKELEERERLRLQRTFAVNKFGETHKTKSKTVDKVESKEASEEMFESWVNRIGKRYNFELPNSLETETPIATDNYRLVKNEFNDGVDKLSQKQRVLKSLYDRQVKVYRKMSMELFTLGSILTKIEARIADITESLYQLEEDENV